MTCVSSSSQNQSEARDAKGKLLHHEHCLFDPHARKTSQLCVRLCASSPKTINRTGAAKVKVLQPYGVLIGTWFLDCLQKGHKTMLLQSLTTLTTLTPSRILTFFKYIS